MGTTAAQLGELMIAAITGETAAMGSVYSPRTWPTTLGAMPAVLVQSPRERKESLGRSGGPQFHAVIVIQVVGRITGRAEASDAGAVALLGALGLLQRQIETATINNYALQRAVQQIVSIDITSGVNTEGDQPVGQLVMDYAFEVYQGPEDFAPIDATPIAQMAIYADLVNVYSPTGDFDGTPFAAAANPSPRTAGPDGRAEAGVILDLPQ